MKKFFFAAVIPLLSSINSLAMEEKELQPFARGGTLTIAQLVLKERTQENIIARLPECNQKLNFNIINNTDVDNLPEALFNACKEHQPQIIRVISINGHYRFLEFFVNPQTKNIEESETLIDENGKIIKLDNRVSDILSITPITWAPKPKRKSQTSVDLNKLSSKD